MRAMLYCDEERVKGQTLRLLESDLDDAGLRKIRVEEIPDDKHYAELTWDVLFFDYGKFWDDNQWDPNPANRIFRGILSYAEENPSRTIVIASQYSEYAIEDLRQYWNVAVPSNVFLNIKLAAGWLHALYADEPEPPPAPSEATALIAPPGWGIDLSFSN